MYLSKIELRREAVENPRFWQGLADPYRFHQMLWRLFSDSPQRRRDFIYRHEGRGAYSVSQRPPESGDDAWRIEVKPYHPRLRPGQRLRFALRANPVVSRRDEQGRQHRHDVVMDAKQALAREGLAREQWPPLGEIVHQACAQWLCSRGPENGFEVNPQGLMAEGYRQLRFPKKRRSVSVSVVELGGLLTVTDPEAFVAMLGRGLGPAKGFGCGLMLVKAA